MKELPLMALCLAVGALCVFGEHWALRGRRCNLDRTSTTGANGFAQ